MLFLINFRIVSRNQFVIHQCYITVCDLDTSENIGTNNIMIF